MGGGRLLVLSVPCSPMPIPLCSLTRPRWPQQVRLTPPTCPLSTQDMTDYVAYVAKDPINQRGEVPVGAGGGPCGQRCLLAEAHLMLCDNPLQPVTSWSAVRALPRASLAPWAKPLSCASNSTCTAPPGWSCPRKGTRPVPSPASQRYPPRPDAQPLRSPSPPWAWASAWRGPFPPLRSLPGPTPSSLQAG